MADSFGESALSGLSSWVSSVAASEIAGPALWSAAALSLRMIVEVVRTAPTPNAATAPLTTHCLRSFMFKFQLSVDYCLIILRNLLMTTIPPGYERRRKER